jgi:GntR family transcriptional regulator / MocR family aminotransferase
MRLQRRWSGRRQGSLVDMPDQGMHLVAYLEADRRDIEIETAAARAGLVVRAISRFYRSDRHLRGQGSCWDSVAIRAMIVPAASHLATVITGRRPARSPDGL